MNQCLIKNKYVVLPRTCGIQNPEIGNGCTRDHNLYFFLILERI